MAQSTLVNVHLEDGWRIAKAMKESGLRITAVYWSFFGLYERWEFHIATPLYEELGPKAVYEQVRPVFKDIEDLDNLSFTDIYLIPPKIKVSRPSNSSTDDTPPTTPQRTTSAASLSMIPAGTPSTGTTSNGSKTDALRQG